MGGLDWSVGRWSGTSTLYRSWLEGAEAVTTGSSEFRCECDEAGTVYGMRIDWTVDGTDQRGFMVLGIAAETGRARGAWMDSWHQAGEPMEFKGELVEGALRATGSYEVEGEQPWGWRIEVKRDGDSLLLWMDNLAPGGADDPAVRAVYHRV